MPYGWSSATPMTSPRFRVIKGGRQEVMLPNGSVVDVRHDPFVQPGLTRQTEFQIILSALNAASSRILKAVGGGQSADEELETANKILAGVSKAITHLRRAR